MSKILLKNIVNILLIIFALNSTALLASDKILITINQFVSHPALDNARLGIEFALQNRKLFPQKVSIKTSNANGNIANAVQIAQYHSSLQPAFMVAIATPSAQANVKVLKDSTLAFVAVSNPTTAGIDQAQNVIGISDAPDIQALINIMSKVIKIKTIGVIFNSGEINSVTTIKTLETIATNNNIKITKIAVNASADIKLAIQKLINNVDVIYIPKDNLVVSSIDCLIQETNKFKIPVIGNDPSLLTKGLLLTVGCDYFESGVQLGNMMSDIIEGKGITYKIQEAKNNKVNINNEVAQKIGITIPEELNTEKVK